MTLTDAAPAPDLLEQPTLWRDWIRKLDNEQLLEARKRIVDWQMSEHGIKFSALERIERMILEEMIRRFPGLVDRVKYLEYAVNLGERDIANLAKGVA